jgi:hypothetical protein
MKTWSLVFIAAAFLRAQTVFGQTAIVGDAWTVGPLSVGTTAQTDAMDVVNSTYSAAAFQVSGVDETPFFQVASSGVMGVGVTPVAGLDVTGSGDSGAISLELDNGTLYPSTGNVQIAFGANGTADLMHSIQSVHSTTTANSSLNFYIWTPAVSTTSMGTVEVLSLVTTSTDATMHVMPATGTPAYELVVSNGFTLGGGTIHRIQELSPSSRAWKTDISYLSEADETQAYEDVRSLRHIRFRYKSWNKKKKKLVRDKKQPLRRGVLYEDAPESIKGTGRSIGVDERLINAEIAAQELIRRLETLEAEANK